MMQSQKYLLQDLEKFLKINEAFEKEIENESLRKLLSVQDKISIFRDIDPYDLEAIVYDVKFVKYKQKDYIIRQKQTREEIFFIISGECFVYSDNKKVGDLRSGEVFGEGGAIFKTPRSASVVCASKDAVLISFCINENNLEFCASAIATLYKNLAFEINAKLEDVNHAFGQKL